MSVELPDLSTRKLLSKKSDLLSDHDRKNRTEEIKKRVKSLVDEQCKLYKGKALGYSAPLYYTGEVESVHIWRENGSYGMLVVCPTTTEEVGFSKWEKGVFYELIPRERRNARMIFNYEDHPNIAFDGLVRVFDIACRVIDPDYGKDDQDEECDVYDRYEDDFKRFGY
jgi:hypothetical protein